MPDRVGALFHALGDPRRRALIETLAQRDGATATELAGDLPVTRQAVAKHLAALHAAGLVTAQRRGREAHYQLTPGPLAEVVAWAEGVGAQWDARLAALAMHLRERA